MKQKYYYNLFIGLFFWLYTVAAFAQPVNNNCTTATTINVGQTCQTVYTNVGATNVGNNGAGTCGDINSGVWFRFVATKSLQRIYLSNYSPTFDATIRVYSGTCGALVPISCTNTAANGANETVDVPTLIPTNTYYIRVTSVNNLNRGNFCLQVYDPTPPNDDCANATPLTMNALCTNGAINGATANAPNGSACGNTNRTVWYSFVATNTTHQIYAKSEDTGLNMDYSVYSGTCAGVLNQIACQNSAGTGSSEFQTHTGLFTMGQTYLIRVNGAAAADVGNFCIRVFAPPSNSNCGTPTSLPTNGTCVRGYTNTATTDGLNPTCTNTNGGSTVWYSFIATSTEHTVTLEVDNLAVSSREDLAITVYRGSCAGLTQIACSDSYGNDLNERAVLTALTVGQTYRIRITGKDTNDQGTFCIKVNSPPPNDDCGTARNLTPNGNCVAGYNYNNINVEAISGDCINNTNMVWYSFVATSTVHTVQLTNVSAWADLGFRVFRSTGGCAVVAVDCREDNGEGGSETQTLTGLIVGTLYYVAVGGDDANDQGEFCIRIEAPPFNDLCQDARELIVNNPCYAANNIGATNSVTDPNACGNESRTVWFKFRATATSHSISLDNRETVSSNTQDVVFTVYSTSDNTCSGTFTQLRCENTGAGDLFGENATLTGLTIGRMYYVMVSGAGSNDALQFCISVTSNNNECVNAVPIVANSECIAGGNRGTSTNGATDGSCEFPSVTVWYSYRPNYSNATLIVEPNPDLNAEVTVFSGTCVGLAEFACEDTPGLGSTETVALNNLIPGNLYYIMVDGQSADEGTFCISIKEPLACGPNPLPANTCDAAPLISNLDGYCGFTNFEYTPNFYNNLSTGSTAFCGNDIENNSFLRFTADAQEVVLELNIVTSSPNGGPPCDGGIQLQVYSVSGNDCTTGFWNPILPACISPSGAVGSTRELRLTNLVPGNVYYIMFDGYGGDECGFVIRAPFGGGVLLPLDLLEFNAKPLEYANQVNWKVVQNYSLGERFWVERSTNQMQFETLGELFHQNGKTVYQFLDETATEKRDYYYRLRTIDDAGKYHFSKTVLISENDEPKIDEKPILIYPNPTDKELNISLRAEQKTIVSIQVLDIQGKVIKEFSKNADQGINKFVVPTQTLQRGLYLIRIMDNLGTISYQEKFIKE